MTGNTGLRARNPGGNSTVLQDWGSNCEYGTLRDVLLGPAATFHWMEDNAQWSSVVRETLRRGGKFDQQVAMRQHREVVEAYEDAGVVVHTISENAMTPYQVYARDSSFMTPYGAVICQLANPRRRGEYAACIRFYMDNDIPIYELVSAGNFEGGDFNMIRPGVVLIGYTGLRTDERSARQVGGWFANEGWEIKYAPIDEFYVHIDLMVCMLSEKAAAVCLDTTPDDVVEWLKRKGIEIVPVSFKDTMALGCNVVSLGDDRILSTAESKGLNAKLKALGFKVYDPDISMFTAAGGGIHCMAQPLRRDRVQ